MRHRNRPKCPHKAFNSIEEVEAFVSSALKTEDKLVCGECDQTVWNGTICLGCSVKDVQVLCGSYEQDHAHTHYEQSRHPLVWNIKSKSVWCHICAWEPEFTSKQIRTLPFTLKHPSPENGRCGFANVGNTCFANAALQVLLHSSSLFTYFCSRRWKNPPAIVSAFIETLESIDSPTGRGIVPRAVLQQMARVHPIFRDRIQHDSHEFFRALIGDLDDSMKKSAMQDSKLVSGSFIADCFEGELESAVKCLECGKVSKVNEPFFDLNLEIPDAVKSRRIEEELGRDVEEPSWMGGMLNSIGMGSLWKTPSLSLEACLGSFCSSESLGSGNKYLCEGCNRKVDAEKSLCISKVPQTLAFHIKRFSPNDFWSTKMSHKVDFPLKSLDLSKFSCQPDPDLFDLVGVVQHIGNSSDGGHYIAYCKDRGSGRFIEFDDTNVRVVDDSVLENVQAYILVYERRDEVEWNDVLEMIGEAGDFVVSVDWILKALALKKPSPMDVFDLFCPHGKRLLNVKEGIDYFGVSKENFETMLKRFGNRCDVLRKSELKRLSEIDCSGCEREKRRQEQERILEIERSISRGTHRKFIISQQWIVRWREYIQKEGAHPGEISNGDIIDDFTLKDGVEETKDFRWIAEPLWKEFVEIYGGGPPLEKSDD